MRRSRLAPPSRERAGEVRVRFGASGSRGRSIVAPANRLMELQQTIGNGALQRLLAVDRTLAQRESTRPVRVLAAITLAKAGKVRGDVKEPGHEGKLEIESIHLSPSRTPAKDRDEAQQTFPVTFTRRSDSVTPLFFRAATDGDPVVSAVFDFVRPDAVGELETLHSLAFGDGLISGFQLAGEAESISIEFASAR